MSLNVAGQVRVACEQRKPATCPLLEGSRLLQQSRSWPAWQRGDRRDLVSLATCRSRLGVSLLHCTRARYETRHPTRTPASR